MGSEDRLIKINKQIADNRQELANIEKEISNLESEKRDIEFKIKKEKCLKEAQSFICNNGNVLNRKLHNELRFKLMEILYKDECYVSSYDQVLRLILDKLDIKYQYLDEKDGNTKWSLLKIEL